MKTQVINAMIGAISGSIAVGMQSPFLAWIVGMFTAAIIAANFMLRGES